MSSGGGGSSPTPVKQVDQAELDRQQSEAQAQQRQIAGKRRGVAGTRLTDPVIDMTSGAGNNSNTQRSRVSLLGGGTYGS